MNDRNFKKWKPFNSVVPTKALLKNDTSIEVPSLSKDELEEFEEKLKMSLYLKTKLEITYIENNSYKTITDYVIKLDSLKKNVYLTHKTINFRQICNIK